MIKKQKSLEEDRMILKKRQEFLDLIKQGLQTFQTDSPEERSSRKAETSSWGRELGLCE